VTKQKLEADDMGYGVWGFGSADLTTYTQGTLVVDFIDPQTHKVFWRGTASEIVANPSNVNASKLNKAVAKLVDQYPSHVANVAS
jgi:hypothetical protein